MSQGQQSPLQAFRTVRHGYGEFLVRHLHQAIGLNPQRVRLVGVLSVSVRTPSEGLCLERGGDLAYLTFEVRFGRDDVVGELFIFRSIENLHASIKVHL